MRFAGYRISQYKNPRFTGAIGEYRMPSVQYGQAQVYGDVGVEPGITEFRAPSGAKGPERFPEFRMQQKRARSGAKAPFRAI